MDVDIFFTKAYLNIKLIFPLGREMSLAQNHDFRIEKEKKK